MDNKYLAELHWKINIYANEMNKKMTIEYKHAASSELARRVFGQVAAF